MIGLSPAEVEIVRSTLSEAFGTEVRVWLFGSRSQGDRRGDVDLFVESARAIGTTQKLSARRQLEGRLHQKVDLIVRTVGEPEAAIDAIARSTGIAL